MVNGFTIKINDINRYASWNFCLIFFICTNADLGADSIPRAGIENQLGGGAFVEDAAGATNENI